MINYFSSKKLFLLNTITAILYIVVFRLVYVDYLVAFHGYGGVYRIENNTMFAVSLTNIIAFLPILLYKAEDKVSDFISIFLYVMVYVPTLIGLQYYYKDYSFVLPYQLAYLFAFTLFFYAGKKTVSPHNNKLNNGIRLQYFILFAVFDILLIVAVFHSRMRLVSFADVYDLRLDAMDFDPGIPFLGYFMMWMSSIVALLVAIGCKTERKFYILLGFLMALVYYMVNAMKAVVFTAVLAYFIYFYIKRFGNKYVFPIITSGIHVSYLLIAFADNSSIGLFISILMNRTYGIASQITPMYIDVFQDHPYTYFSHINVVNMITGMYPFGNQSLGYAITDLYHGTFSQANTNFLVTDGISSCGLFGIFFISIVFYYLLIYLNNITNRFGFAFVASSIMGTITAFANMSIFTTLLSCGLIFLIIFYKYVKF